MNKNKIKKNISEIKKVLEKSRVALSPDMKIALAELILNIRSRHRNKFGLFVILGWQKKWNKSTDISDETQDLFKKHHMNIMKLGKRRVGRRDVSATTNFDGAILIDKNGNVIHSGVIIEGLRLKIIAQKINPGRFNDLSEQFGFKEKVHARHLSAIASSYVFKNTAVFTVSEESGAFHVFENGRIIYSCN